jgi:hypothetical protein
MEKSIFAQLICCVVSTTPTSTPPTTTTTETSPPPVSEPTTSNNGVGGAADVGCDFCYNSNRGDFDGTVAIYDPDTLELVTCQDYADRINITTIPQDSQLCSDKSIYGAFFCCIQPAGEFGDGGVNSVCSKEVILLGFCMDAELEIYGNDCESCFPAVEEEQDDNGEGGSGSGAGDEAGDNSDIDKNSWCLVPTEVLVNAKECCPACLSYLELTISCLENDENCPASGMTTTTGGGGGGGAASSSSSSSLAATRTGSLPNTIGGSLMSRTVTAVVIVLVSLCV